MGSAQRIPIAGRLGLCGMLALLLRVVAPRPAPAVAREGAAAISAPQPRTPAEVALRQACRWYGRATQVATGRVEALQDWDPQATGSASPEARRRAAIAGTRELQWAIRGGERAAHLAITRGDRYEAALLLSRLYCDAGLHSRELAQARLLMALSPKSFASLKALRRAAGCNHRPSLARQADRAMEALPAGTTGSRSPFGLMAPP